jgi:DNA polymerase III delta subunit
MTNSGSVSKFKRYYLFYGTDEYSKWNRVKDLVRAAIASGFEDFDCNYFAARGLDVANLINIACSAPVASPLRVMVIRDIDKLAPKGQELLEKFIPRIPEHTTIAMTSEKIDARKKLFKTLLKDIKACVAFNELTHDKAVEIVIKAAQAHKTQISPEAAAYLVESVGCNPGRLEQEVAKLAIAENNKVIQKADIAEMCGAGLSGTISDLPEKIIEGDLTGALILLHYLLLSKESEGSILYRLKEYFLRLNTIKLYNAPPPVVIRILGLNPLNTKLAENLSRHARKVSVTAITDCLHLIYESEIQLKSAGLAKDIILFDLVNRLGLVLK